MLQFKPGVAIAMLLAMAGAAYPADRPVPSFADVSYGPRALQLLDLYVPSGAGQPVPALLWFGGLWKPAKRAPDPGRFTGQGIAVIGVQVRTITLGMEEKADPPISYVMNDACRAVQFVRANAAKWNIDPERLATGGSSQGALPALYVACAPDHANPSSQDSVERASSKVICAIAHRSQPSIDPVRMQEWVPGVKWGAPALGCSFEESLKRREELLPVIKKWSPDWLLHPGTPPLYFENNWGLERPKEIQEMDYKVHSPAWALGFSKLAQAQGVTCLVNFPGHPTEKYKDIWDFVVQQLKAPAK